MPEPHEQDIVNHRFGFNGKEKDNEIKGKGNSYDYKARIYDSRLGKFLSVDPLQKEYVWNSPYAFAENDVIRSIDLDGLEKVIYTFTYANNKWTQTKIELPKAGTLGNGALVKFDGYFFYGNELPAGSNGKDFTKSYESKSLTGYVIPGESQVTIGYGHAVLSPEDKAKYQNGTVITNDEANNLFNSDYAKGSVNIPGLNQQQTDALNDYSFNTSDNGTLTENSYNNSSTKDANYFLKRSASFYIGVKVRRAAEYILFKDSKYFKLDYSTSAQKTWENVYNNCTNTNTSTGSNSSSGTGSNYSSTSSPGSSESKLPTER